MRYVNPSGKILAHTDRLDAWRRGEKPAPIGVEWDLSNRCSLGCAGCHFGYTHTRGPLAGKRDKPGGGTDGDDLADTDLVLRALQEMADFGVKSIVWSGGGEPTLHPRFKDIILYAPGELKQGLYTHGGHIDGPLASAIGSTHEWVVVSLDCIDAESYAAYKQVPPVWFGRACEGVRLLVARGGCTVGISYLLDAGNWRDAPRMAELSRELGADYATFRPMVHYAMDNPAMPSESARWINHALPLLRKLANEPDIECLPERFEIYRDWRRERPYPACHGIKFSTTITPNGKVWVCPNRREFPDSCLGDLREESFAAIWARHPGQWTDFEKCRVLCRLHMVNQAIAPVYAEHAHQEFI